MMPQNDKLVINMNEASCAQPTTEHERLRRSPTMEWTCQLRSRMTATLVGGFRRIITALVLNTLILPVAAAVACDKSSVSILPSTLADLCELPYPVVGSTDPAYNCRYSATTTSCLPFIDYELSPPIYVD